MELVTGKKGTAHITPRQDACFHRGVVGHESGLLRYHEAVASTASATEISIGEMELMVQGRYIIIEPNDSDTLNIDTPAGAGNKRIDLAVVKVSPNADGTQSAEWEIITGESAATNPVTPTFESGLLDNGETARYAVIKIEVGATSITGVSIVASEIGGGCPMLLRRFSSSEIGAGTHNYDWSKFKAIEILFHDGSSVKMPCDPNNNEHGTSVYSPTSATGAQNFYFRRVGLMKNGSDYFIQFWDCIRAAVGTNGTVTLGTYNSVCVPREIYAYN